MRRALLLGHGASPVVGSLPGSSQTLHTVVLSWGMGSQVMTARLTAGFRH